MSLILRNNADVHYTKANGDVYCRFGDYAMSIRSTEYGTELTVERYSEKPIGKIIPGNIVWIESKEWIVLGHGADTTAIMTLRPIEKMKMNNYYGDSDMRTHLVYGATVMPFIFNVIDRAMIVSHTVKLHDDMGRHAKHNTKDPVSILTADLYRRYRHVIPSSMDAFWLATPYSFDQGEAAEGTYVSVGGNILHCPVGENSPCLGVHPFMVIDSSFTKFNGNNVSGPWEHDIFELR